MIGLAIAAAVLISFKIKNGHKAACLKQGTGDVP